ncbi:YbhN family protein [Microbacterium sp. NPDC057407]|uniref:lysylphosphatidylglycerol synthase transmembrane domain-containing protein n=1 Tax=Microbacterium sp. NPDC057407 TaxID=3346120 RepID=UPI0036700F98
MTAADLTAPGAERAGSPGAPAAVRRQRLGPRAVRWIRFAAGGAVLAGVIAVAGAEPFLRGLRSISPEAILAAAALTALATVAASWRWRVIARRLGLRLGWGEAVAAYYRSQFLNTVLPGGVVGDVHRAVAHGRSVEQLAQAGRAVAGERAAGQVVQLTVTLGVLVALGASAYAPAMGIVLVAMAGATAVAAIATVSRRARATIARELRLVRDALGTPGAVVPVVAASVLVMGAHVTTFVVACLAVGVTAPFETVAFAALVAMLASSIPLSAAGWGPREGAAAWAFGVVGLGAAAGIAAATAYGILSMIALLPGAVVVAASARRRPSPTAAEPGRVS